MTTATHIKVPFIKALIVFVLLVEKVEAEAVHPAGCEGDCDVIAPTQEEFVAQEIQWDLDLAIEAKPVYGNNPEQIFSQLFHAVDKDGKKIAGLTDTKIDLSHLHWSAHLECETPSRVMPTRTCYVTDGTPRFELVDLITGGPEYKPESDPFHQGAVATTNYFYRGKPVVRPKVKVRVFIGWPTVGIASLPLEWRKPILDSIYLILGHEKLHVDNFMAHLPRVASALLHPNVTSFELLPGEDPQVKFNEVARAAAVEALNRELFDPTYSGCKRMNCEYDGKGPNCAEVAATDHERRVAATWNAPHPMTEEGFGELKLKMFVDNGAHYPGPKSPVDFKLPQPFEFRWAQQ